MNKDKQFTCELYKKESLLGEEAYDFSHVMNQRNDFFHSSINVRNNKISYQFSSDVGLYIHLIVKQITANVKASELVENVEKKVFTVTISDTVYEYDCLFVKREQDNYVMSKCDVTTVDSYVSFKETNIIRKPFIYNKEDGLKLVKNIELTSPLESTEVSVIDTAKKVDFQFIKDQYDLSKHLEQEFVAIDSEESFNDIVKEYLNLKNNNNNEKILVSIDTETTGLHVFNSKNADKIVAIPLRFSILNKKGKFPTYLVFTRMQYFDNVPHKIWTDFFKQIAVDEKNGEIFVVGHNISFDKRAFLVEDIDINFTFDTMQAGFALNQLKMYHLDLYNIQSKKTYKDFNDKTIKSGLGLDKMALKFFDFHMLHLDHILGKGNEDKFCYLYDKEVAVMYGCADAYITGELVFPLIKLLKEMKIYDNFMSNMMPYVNLMGKADFNGVHVDDSQIALRYPKYLKDKEILHDVIYNYVGKYIKINYLRDIFIDKCPDKSEEEVMEMVAIALKKKPPLPYVFNISSDELSNVLFTSLGYKVLAYSEKTGKPSISIKVFEQMTKEKLDVKSKEFQDIYGSEGNVMIKGDVLNELKYPLIYILSHLAHLNKKLFGYYAPLYKEKSNFIFKNTKCAATDTSRSVNPIQTYSKEIKEVVVPRKGYYMLNCDFSQQEYRVLAGVSKEKELINLLNEDEVDIHIIVASVANECELHKVTPEMRSRAKSIGFGLVYGLGLRSFCISVFGEYNDANLAKLTKMNDNLNSKLSGFMNVMTDTAQKFSENITISEKMRHYLSQPTADLGIARNLAGFYNIIPHSKNPIQESSNILKARNFPIQSFAAFITREAAKNLMELADKFDRKYNIKNSLLLIMTVHDEFLIEVDERVNAVEALTEINKVLTVKIEGHPEYRIGMNLVDNWNEGKVGMYELPTKFVKEINKNPELFDWDTAEDGKKAGISRKIYFYNKTKEYLYERFRKKVYENVVDGKINVTSFVANFTEYIFKSLIIDYTGVPAKTLAKEENADEKIMSACINVVCPELEMVESYLKQDIDSSSEEDDLEEEEDLFDYNEDAEEDGVFGINFEKVIIPNKDTVTSNKNKLFLENIFQRVKRFEVEYDEQIKFRLKPKLDEYITKYITNNFNEKSKESLPLVRLNSAKIPKELGRVPIDIKKLKELDTYISKLIVNCIIKQKEKENNT